MATQPTTSPVDLFDTTYGNFRAHLHQQVRAETFGEEFGQNSWTTADEYRRFLGWLRIDASSVVLDVACGAGGPAAFVARETGARVVGIDAHAEGIAQARDAAGAAALEEQLSFVQGDGNEPLPFDDGEFDAVICIDAIHHFLSRPKVLAQMRRVLRPGGRVLYTDPVVVSGIVTNEEIAVRSSIGYFQFSPVGEDERLLARAGFDLERREDVTANAALVAGRWLESRARHREELLKVESETNYTGLQKFLSMVHTVSVEHRLSRIAFVGRRPVEDAPGAAD